jgi:hypothetical protein
LLAGTLAPNAQSWRGASTISTTSQNFSPIDLRRHAALCRHGRLPRCFSLVAQGGKIC